MCRVKYNGERLGRSGSATSYVVDIAVLPKSNNQAFFKERRIIATVHMVGLTLMV